MRKGKAVRATKGPKGPREPRIVIFTKSGRAARADMVKPKKSVTGKKALSYRANYKKMQKHK
jgi:hypothetical protein